MYNIYKKSKVFISVAASIHIIAKLIILCFDCCALRISLAPYFLFLATAESSNPSVPYPNHFPAGPYPNPVGAKLIFT